MMLKRASIINSASHRCRTVPVVQCAASALEPNTYAPPRERGPRNASSDANTSAPPKGWQNRRARRSQENTTGSDAQQQQQRQQQQQQSPPKQVLPSVVFLEDDVASITYKVRSLYQRCFAEGNGVAVRSLGRQGAAGAMRFLLAMREEGAAAADERDVCIRLVPQEPLKPFGTPLLLIVTAVRGRTQLPPENSPQCVPLSVASRTDSPRLETKVLRELNNLQPGQFLRLDMVGTDALYRGLSALRDAQERIPAASYNFFAVPELVSVPVRARREPSQLQQQQQQQGSPRQEQAGQGQKQQQQGAESTEETAPRVQVVRLYVGRSRSAPTQVSASSPSSSSTPATEANAGQQQPVAGASIPGVDPERPGKGKVLVSEAELQELKGALGSMMEQQKMLVQLINQRQEADGGAGLAASQA